jgi:hypothetical protein
MAYMFNSLTGKSVDYAHVDIGLTDTAAQYTLGAKHEDERGRVFRYVQASGAVTAGAVLQQTDVLSLAVNADVDAAQAANTRVMTGTGDFTVGTEDGRVVYIDAGTGAGQGRFIERVQDANTIRISEAWTTALATDADFVVFSPYIVEDHAAGATGVCGVAVVAIAASSFGWVQTEGLCMVDIDGSQDPIVANRLVTAGTAVAGTAEGFATGAVAAADLEGIVGYGVIDVGALDITAPVFLNVGVKM